MGRRGPRPKPTPLRLLEGNPGKLPINDREPKPPRINAPEPPRTLDAIGRAEWRRQAAWLDVLGMFTEADPTMLEVYCGTYAELRQLRAQMRTCLRRLARLRRRRDDKLAEEIRWLTEEIGRLHARIDRKVPILRQLAGEFGFSPASRVRLEHGDAPPVAPKRPTGTEGRGKDASRFFVDH